MAQLTAYPNSVDTSISKYDSVVSNYPFSNVYGKSETSTSSTRWNLVEGKNAVTEVYFTFDLSAVPSDASVGTVSCIAKGAVENDGSARGGKNRIALCNGTTVLVQSDEETFEEKAATASVSTTGFTRSTLDNLRFKYQITRGSMGTDNTYYAEFFGCTLTVEYTVSSGDKFLLKTNGVWNEYTQVYKKVNGAWGLQTDMKTIFDSDMKYV